MKLTFRRLDDRRYETLIERDGVRYRLNGPGHMFALPHDLEHFVVEKNLRLKNGFWGSIADGAVVRGMSYLDGRRKPHAEERSKAILKANERPLAEVEVIVRLFREGVDNGGAVSVHRALAARQAATAQKLMTFDVAAVGDTVTGWLEARAAWEKQTVGGALSLIWKQ
jgi:hypothetical protein